MQKTEACSLNYCLYLSALGLVRSALGGLVFGNISASVADVNKHCANSRPKGGPPEYAKEPDPAGYERRNLRRDQNSRDHGQLQCRGGLADESRLDAHLRGEEVNNDKTKQKEKVLADYQNHDCLRQKETANVCPL